MSQSPDPAPPPRAFTQGVGTIFQVGGVLLFVSMMFVCCASAFFSMQVAKRPDLGEIGWRLPLPERPLYSVQRATSITLAVAIGLGVAVASLGLGLQAMHRRAPLAAVLVSSFGVAFWFFHAVFFLSTVQSVLLMIVCLALGMLFTGFLGLSIASWREMAANPPPPDLTDLPAGYKIPYSHLHDDPPEVRLAKELDERRRKLEIQQKELEALEERIKKHRYD